MKFAQILYGKAHWVFEAESKPEFAPNIIIKEITNHPEIKEGWTYDANTDSFSEPIIQPIEPQVNQEEMQMQTLLNTEYLVIMSELTNL